MKKICSSFRHGSSRMNTMRLPWLLKGRSWKSVKDTDRRNCRKERTRQTSIMSLGRKKSKRILKGFLRVRNLRIREFLLLLLHPLLLHPLRLPPSLRTIISGFLMAKSLRSGGNCIMMGRSRCAPTAIRWPLSWLWTCATSVALMAIWWLRLFPAMMAFLSRRRWLASSRHSEKNLRKCLSDWKMYWLRWDRKSWSKLLWKA